MPQIISYLTFNGNCREAMEFYRECLGGELRVQTIGDAPMSEQMPARMKKAVLHAELTRGELILMASDMTPEEGLNKGNHMSMMLSCASEAETRDLYRKLAAGGNPSHPPEPTFQGALFGHLTDRFGNQWLLHCEQKITE